jgi:Putative transposase DNA-binding domain
MSAAANCSNLQVGTDGLKRVARGAAVLGRCLRSRKALVFTLELLWLVASGVALVKLIHVLADRSPDPSLSFGQLAVVVADPFFPSSKRCSVCKWIYAELTLSERVWTCANCGMVHDRDDNASANLEEFALSSTVTACGGNSAGLGAQRKVKLVPAKQEPEHEIKDYV